MARRVGIIIQDQDCTLSSAPDLDGCRVGKWESVDPVVSPVSVQAGPAASQPRDLP